jgi:hypothetical protein
MARKPNEVKQAQARLDNAHRELRQATEEMLTILNPPDEELGMAQAMVDDQHPEDFATYDTLVAYQIISSREYDRE